MALKFDNTQVYEMPVFFGPVFAQQQPWEGGKKMYNHFQPSECKVLNITFETDRKILEDMIPECYTLRDPFVTVAVCEFNTCGWLNGKGYNLINVNVPVHFKGERDDLDGDLVLVMYENNTDPIIGGRELLGYGKLYCEIPPIQHNENKYIALASAYNKQFMKIEIDTSKAPKDPEPVKANEAKSKGKMQFKYIAATRELEESNVSNFTRADVAYPTILPKWVRPDDYPYPQRTPDVKWGDGTIEFSPITWEDWPTYGHAAAGLAKLPVKRVLCARTFTYDEPAEYDKMYRLR